MTRGVSLLLGWSLALALAAGFSALGRWQLGRAVEKESVVAAAAAVLQNPAPVALDRAWDRARAGAYDWAEGTGTFAELPPLLLDNQQRAGRVGVRVYRAFQPGSGRPLLVDTGWLPLPADRTLPVLPRLAGEHAIRGLLVPPPSPGLALGTAMGARGEAGWLMTRVDLDAIGQALGMPLAPRVLRLDPVLPLGHERDLDLLPNTLPPEKHRGYALQWFGLALASLLTALVLTIRTRNRGKATPR